MLLKPQVTNAKRIGSDLPINERAEAACNVAKRLETAGDYDTAYEALSEFWPDPNAAPNLTDLEEPRSEEHTSELQSRLHLVCRLLLEKKNASITSGCTEVRR